MLFIVDSILQISSYEFDLEIIRFFKLIMGFISQIRLVCYCFVEINNEAEILSIFLNIVRVKKLKINKIVNF